MPGHRVKLKLVAGLVWALTASGCSMFEESVSLTAEGCERVNLELGRQSQEAEAPIIPI